MSTVDPDGDSDYWERTADVSYWSGPATATAGNGTFTPGQPTAAEAIPVVGLWKDAFTHTGGTGASSASWNPTIKVGFGDDRVAGTYRGTIFHSVA